MKKIVIDPKHIDYTKVQEAAQVIVNNGIVALPSETVYGLAARADRRDLAERLYNLKNRPQQKHFSLALSEPDLAVTNYFAPLTPFAHRVIERFWPGPLTIVYYSLKNGKIGIRVPAHMITRAILKEVGVPVCFPSANLSGQSESLSAYEVEAIFPKGLDLIVDGGECLYGQASTVLDLTAHPFKILRAGVILEEDIVDAFIRKRIMFVCTGNSCRSPMAEVLLKRYLAEQGMYFVERYEVISRGIAATNGMAVSKNAAKVLMQEENIDVASFTAQKIERNIILTSDIIITMEEAQREYILRLEPTTEGRVFVLNKFLSQEWQEDIPDPIGQDYDAYYQVYSLIKKGVLELSDWL